MAKTNLTIPELGNKFIDYRDKIWGDSFSWVNERSSADIKLLAIHHSVTSHDATPDKIAELHKVRGWGGIGYHFVITKDGNVYYVGDISTARANVYDMNDLVIGICMVGDFTKHLPSDEQITSCHKLCQFFIDIASVPNVKSWDDVVGHKGMKMIAPDYGRTSTGTLCPGTSWDKSIDGDMWWRIKTGTVYTKPPEDEVVEAGGEEAVTAYDEFIQAVCGLLKMPVGCRDFALIRKKIAEVVEMAKNAKEKDEEFTKFVENTAQAIGCSDTNKTAVSEALIKLEAEIKAIKSKRLEQFTKRELLKEFFRRFFKRGGKNG